MKREYIGILFIIGFVALIFLAEYFIDEEKIMDYLSRFIVIWILVAFQIGQYSMRYPKAF